MSGSFVLDEEEDDEEDSENEDDEDGLADTDGGGRSNVPLDALRRSIEVAYRLTEHLCPAAYLMQGADPIQCPKLFALVYK